MKSMFENNPYVSPISVPSPHGLSCNFVESDDSIELLHRQGAERQIQSSKSVILVDKSKLFGPTFTLEALIKTYEFAKYPEIFSPDLNFGNGQVIACQKISYSKCVLKVLAKIVKALEK